MSVEQQVELFAGTRLSESLHGCTLVRWSTPNPNQTKERSDGSFT